MTEPQPHQHVHFNEIADEYDDSLPPHVVEHYLAKRVAYVRRILPSGKVLDVGCGTGVVAGRLAEAGYEVTGVDPSAGMLRYVEEHAPGVTAIEGSATDLPFEDGTFDLTMCVAVLHHIIEPEAVHQSLVEMVRVTKPGGLVLVWDHNPRNPYWKNLMARVPQDDGTERLIPEAEILDGLADGGAKVIRSDQLGLVPDFVPPRLLGLAAGSEKVAEKVPGVRRLCAHNVVLARRP
ncbi:MAG: methyltransferase domain-containing protein [Solirubrobacterales bacterium]|nr:methyltransferase domain-containing protein [Solirubrobacterales bacterium]HRV61117.1 class I SAM-dependent methyltransferase [Solirubrobacterales bacterium]